MPRHNDEAGSSRPKRTRVTKTVKEAMLGRVHHEFLLWDWNVLNTLDCAEAIDEMLEIKIVEMGGQEKIFTSEAWRRAFDINEPIYTELCHEFYSTYEFDEEVTNEELITKKLINLRLGARGHSLTLLENDDHFNARDYWLSISNEDELHLSRSYTQTIRSPILRVLQKMITYGLCQRTIRYDKIQRNELWLMSMFEAKHQNGYANVARLIAKWLKRKEVRERESIICCGQFVTRMAKKMNMLTDEVVDGLSALIYCRSLDATIFRELIGSNGGLSAEDPTPDVPRGELERISRRQSYHSDKYAGVLEFMDGHYGVPLAGPYAPPWYDE
ncbi:hypothetical protein Tco_0218256 [Tanacetum coccineum]